MAIRRLKIQRKSSKEEETKDLLKSIQKDLQALVDQVEECLETSSENTLLDKHANNKHTDPDGLINE